MFLSLTRFSLVSESENKNIYAHFTAAINPVFEAKEALDVERRKDDAGKSVESNYSLLQSAPDASWDGGVFSSVARFVMKAALALLFILPPRPTDVLK